ncbi:hypothetical protein RUND412_008280 [Rhizina undulata]
MAVYMEGSGLGPEHGNLKGAIGKAKMEAVILDHSSLQARLKGVVLQRDPPIVQYRGIKFGEVPARFCRSIAVGLAREVDCTEFGPRCPQVPCNFSTLFRIPDSYGVNWKEPEDEFECLNLHVTVPAGMKEGDDVPVLVWIHGGGFTTTCGSASTKTADPRRIVETSMKMGTPVILVGINYRLNFFGFSYLGESMSNLGILDQRMALEWVGTHIGAFGGDKNNITVFGESAGGMSTHAHIQGSKRGLFKRAILMSGHSYVTPSLPIAFGQALVSRVCEYLKISQIGDWIEELRKVPAEGIVEALQELEVHGMGILDDGSFYEGKWDRDYVPDWVESIMLGDCEFESIIFNKAYQALSAPEIVALFNTPKPTPISQSLLDVYNITPTDDIQARHGALNFLSDTVFGFHNGVIASQFRAKGKRAFQYIVDQRSPWDPNTARAHHTVDILLLFGGFELTEIDPEARRAFEKVGDDMRQKWIEFSNGIDPWDAGRVYGFGPNGECGEVSEEEFARRRRVLSGYKVIEQTESGTFNSIVTNATIAKVCLDPGVLPQL